MTTKPADFNVTESINRRIEEVSNERRVMKESLESIQIKLQGLLAKLKDRPRESEAELLKATRDLEFWHSTTTQDNASERKFMLDMDKLKKKRVALAEFAQIQDSIDNLKIKRKDMQALFREKDKILDELHQALRKIKTASRVGCDASDVVEQVLVAAEDKIPVTVFNQISEKHSVTLTTSRVGGNRAIRVQGLPVDVAAAFEKMEDMLTMTTEEVKISQGTLFCLLMASATLVHRIEESCDVRIDISRANMQCKVMGKPANVTDAMAEIESIQSATVQIPVESSSLPAIIGTKGQNLRSIEEDKNVSIDIDRDKNVISISGFIDDVASAVEVLRSVSTNNRLVEEIIRVDRHVYMGCLMKDGASVLRAANKNYPSVSIQTLKPDDNSPISSQAPAANAATSPKNPVHASSSTKTGGLLSSANLKAGSATSAIGSKNPEKGKIDAVRAEAPLVGKGVVGKRKNNSLTETLLIRGPYYKVKPCTEYLQSQLDEYLKHVTTISVARENLPYIIGSKGSRIDAMRKNHPSASVDIEGEKIHIYCSIEESRKAICAEILNVVDENSVEVLEFDEDILKILLSPKGANTRNYIQDDCLISMDIKVENKEIKLRGRSSAIDAAKVALHAFQAENSLIEISVTEDDCNALTGGGVSSIVKDHETKFSVEIYVNRKQLLVKIRGAEDAAIAAAASIKKIIYGEEGSESQVLEGLDTNDIRLLIGPEGKRIASFEKQNNVRIDVIRSTGKARIRGSTSLSVSEAVAQIMSFLDNTVDIERIFVPENTSPNSLKRFMDSVLEMFQVKKVSSNRRRNSEESEPVDGHNKREGNFIELQGKRRVLKVASKYFKELLSGVEQYTLILESSIYQDVRPHFNSEKSLASFRKYGVEISFNENISAIELDGGDSTSTTDCKIMMFRMLEELRPGHFASIPLEAGCLSEIYANRIDKIVQSNTDTSVTFDFPFSSVRVCGSPANVDQAAALIRDSATAWRKRHITINFKDLAVIPYLLGKKGSVVNDIQKQTSTNIKIDSVNMLVTIDGSDENGVSTASQLIKDRIGEYTAQNWEMSCNDPQLLSSLIGKKGENIKVMRAGTGAEIFVNIDAGSIKVTGSANNVENAKIQITAFIAAYEENNGVMRLMIPRDAFPALVGPKGETIKELQKSADVRRLDLVREENMLLIRGSRTSCQAAKEKIEALLLPKGYAVKEKFGDNGDSDVASLDSSHNSVSKVPVVSSKVDTSRFHVPVGSAGYSKINGESIANNVQLSKSALRRLRRKQESSSAAVSVSATTSDESENLKSAALTLVNETSPNISNQSLISEYQNLVIQQPTAETEPQKGAVELVHPFSPFSKSNADFGLISGHKSETTPEQTLDLGNGNADKSAHISVRNLRSAKVGIIGRSAIENSDAPKAASLNNNHFFPSTHGASLKEAPVDKNFLLSLLLDDGEKSPSKETICQPISKAEDHEGYKPAATLSESSVISASFKQSVGANNNSGYSRKSAPTTEGYYKSKNGSVNIRL